jgi:hypothetical protein
MYVASNYQMLPVLCGVMSSRMCKEHAHYMGVIAVRGMHCSILELERT